MPFGRKKKTKIYLVRHAHARAPGETGFRYHDVRGPLKGRPEPELTKQGKKEAMLLAKRLRKLRLLGGIKAVYTSPLLRAKQTAEIVFSQFKPKFIELPELREMFAGKEWEGLSPEEIQKKWPKEFKRFRKTLSIDMPGAESLEDVQKRALAAVERIVEENRGRRVAIVGHYELNRAILAKFLGIPIENAQVINPKNADLNIIVITDTRKRRKTRVKKYGDIRHLRRMKPS